jgi:hypothetical protein
MNRVGHHCRSVMNHAATGSPCATLDKPATAQLHCAVGPELESPNVAVILVDALFIFSGVGPPLWFGNYFWVRPYASDRIGARFGCRCTALRLASLAFAPFRASAI